MIDAFIASSVVLVAAAIGVCIGMCIVCIGLFFGLRPVLRALGRRAARFELDPMGQAVVARWFAMEARADSEALTVRGPRRVRRIDVDDIVGLDVVDARRGREQLMVITRSGARIPCGRLLWSEHDAYRLHQAFSKALRVPVPSPNWRDRRARPC